MIRELNNEQVEATLRGEGLGRISFVEGGRTYVVPVRYHYETSGRIYGRPTMEATVPPPETTRVQFEVESVQGPGTWRSVLAWGALEGSEDPRSYRIRLTGARGFSRQRTPAP
jgi:nitroimidazol reductase NimA-like FMN-containing flavoprotein (pyridoxamine 5'-phosphate oxidase superfamily)